MTDPTATRETSRADIIRRLRVAYHDHPDRDYAEHMYGGLLRDMGATPMTEPTCPEHGTPIDLPGQPIPCDRCWHIISDRTHVPTYWDCYLPGHAGICASVPDHLTTCPHCGTPREDT